MLASAWGPGLDLGALGTWGQTRLNGSWGFASGRVAWSGGRVRGRMKRCGAGLDTASASPSDHSFVIATVCAHVRVRVRGGSGGEGVARGEGRRTASLSRGCLRLAHGDR